MVLRLRTPSDRQIDPLMGGKSICFRWYYPKAAKDAYDKESFSYEQGRRAENQFLAHPDRQGY